MKIKILHDTALYDVLLLGQKPLKCAITGPDGDTSEQSYHHLESGSGRVRLGDRIVGYHVTQTANGYWVTLAGETYFFSQAKGSAASHEELHSGFNAPMPGKIISLNTEVGVAVEKGDVLVVMEAMKMEHRIEAPAAGKVSGFHCRVGDLVDLGACLLDFEPE